MPALDVRLQYSLYLAAIPPNILQLLPAHLTFAGCYRHTVSGLPQERKPVVM